MFKEYLTRFRESITEGNPNNGICFDGAANPEVYLSKRPRLLFFLKETNGNNNDGSKNDVLEDWDYMEWVRNQAAQQEPLYRSVYRNIAMWSRLFEMYSGGATPVVTDLIDSNGLIIDATLCRALEGIALINLKKSWGTEYTNLEQMKDYLSSDPVRVEILRHQLNALDPDLVLCGGTFDFVYDIFGEKEPIQEVRCADGQLINWFSKGKTMFASCYHPSKPGWSRVKSFAHADNIFRLFFEMHTTN